MASPGNQHCASCIGTLSFRIAWVRLSPPKCHVSRVIIAKINVADWERAGDSVATGRRDVRIQKSAATVRIVNVMPPGIKF